VEAIQQSVTRKALKDPEIESGTSNTTAGKAQCGALRTRGELFRFWQDRRFKYSSDAVALLVAVAAIVRSGSDDGASDHFDVGFLRFRLRRGVGFLCLVCLSVVE